MTVGGSVWLKHTGRVVEHSRFEHIRCYRNYRYALLVGGFVVWTVRLVHIWDACVSIVHCTCIAMVYSDLPVRVLRVGFCTVLVWTLHTCSTSFCY